MEILQDYTYPIEVTFDNGIEYWFTPDGKFEELGKRTLFFSEPKVEASVTRPFTSTLVGKRVVIFWDEDQTNSGIVTKETADIITLDSIDWYKEDLDGIYEISSENLLK